MAHSAAKNRITRLASMWATTVLCVITYQCVGCGDESSGVNARGPTSFDDVFAPRDTIRMDESILVGNVGGVDVSSRGELVVADFVAGGVSIYGPSGAPIRELDPTECDPGAQDPKYARYIFDDNVLVSTGYSAFLFDSDGSCNKRLDSLVPVARTYCSTGDRIFGYNPSRLPWIKEYSSNFEMVREIDLGVPRSPQVVAVNNNPNGRNFMCDVEGPRYLYPDNSDAMLVDSDSAASYEPAGYRRPSALPERYSLDVLSAKMSELDELYNTAIAVYSLDDYKRVVVFLNPKGERSDGAYYLFNVIDEVSGESYSFRTGKRIVAARKGRVYFHETQTYSAGSAVLNPVLTVFEYAPQVRKTS